MGSLREHIVTLSDDERAILSDIVSRGPPQRYRVRRALVLLKLDNIPDNKGWTYEEISEQCGIASTSVKNIAKRFVQGGFEAALERKEQRTSRGWKKDASERTKVILAIVGSAPPEGQSRWTIRLVKERYNALCDTELVSEAVVHKILTDNGVDLRELASLNLTGWRAAAVELIKSAPPDGRTRWTCQLIAEELIRTGVVSQLAGGTVWLALKRMNVSLR